MSDFNSSLPIRTEENGDVSVKVSDGLVPSQQLTINTDGSVNITDNNTSLTVDSVDLDIRDLTFTNDKADVTGSDITAEVRATDLDIRDLTHVSDSAKIGDGVEFLEINTDGSINVVILEDVGLEITDFNTAAAVAGGATSQHDYTFSGPSKFFQVLASASGKLKIEVQIETGAATGIFNTITVGFNSTANPNVDLRFSKYASIPAGARVRIIRTNNDKQAQDVYSTIIGIQG